MGIKAKSEKSSAHKSTVTKLNKNEEETSCQTTKNKDEREDQERRQKISEYKRCTEGHVEPTEVGTSS